MSKPAHVRGSDMWDFLAETLRDPVDGSTVVGVDEEQQFLTFSGGQTYPVVGGCPVLIDEDVSLFSISDIVNERATTQDRSYRDRGSLKNFFRQRVLPQLGDAAGQRARCEEVERRAPPGPALVIGAGDRVTLYEEAFNRPIVVTTDVHRLFGPDLVCDAHRIPFADSTFSLVLAEQVLEHTSHPWVVAGELERVTREGGVIHAATPFAFPWHGVPYDYFRFTPTGLRSLFPQSELESLAVTDGPGAAAATYLSAMVIEQWNTRLPRQIALVLGRIAFAWLKHLDRRRSLSLAQRASAARGLAVTLRCDGRARTDREMLDEVESFVFEVSN